MTNEKIEIVLEKLRNRLDTENPINALYTTSQKVRSENFLFEQFVARLTAAYNSSGSEIEFKFSFFGEQINIIESVATEVAQKMPDAYYRRFGNGAYYILTLAVHWHLRFAKDHSWDEARSPFEPIIRLLERGGTITREGRSYFTGNRSFRETKIETEVVKLLDDEFLSNL